MPPPIIQLTGLVLPPSFTTWASVCRHQVRIIGLQPSGLIDGVQWPCARRECHHPLKEPWAELAFRFVPGLELSDVLAAEPPPIRDPLPSPTVRLTLRLPPGGEAATPTWCVTERRVDEAWALLTLRQQVAACEGLRPADEAEQRLFQRARKRLADIDLFLGALGIHQAT